MGRAKWAGLGVCPHPERFPKKAVFPAVGISPRRGYREHPVLYCLGTVEWAGKASEKCLLRERERVRHLSQYFQHGCPNQI